MLILDSVRDVTTIIQELSNIQSLWGINAQGEPELLYGDGDFKEEILGFEFKISPLAFLQVNPIQTRKL